MVETEKEIKLALLLENKFIKELLKDYITANLSDVAVLTESWEEADILILGYNYLASAHEEVLKIIEQEKKLLILDFDFEEEELIVLLNLLPIKGIIYKDMPLEHLEKCIKVVNKGELWIKRTTIEKLIKYDVAVSSLTPRELRIVYYLLEGLTNKEIGRKLNISEQTVKHYINSILKKIKRRNRIDIVLSFYRFKKLLKLILLKESVPINV